LFSRQAITVQFFSLRHALLLGTAALLSGCALFPDLPRPFALRGAGDIASTRSFESGRAAWPEGRWWTRYNDSQLAALIETGLEHSPSVAEAAARIRQAEGVAIQTGAPLYPQIEANGTVQKVKQSYNNGIPSDFVPRGFQETGRATLDLNWQLDFWGRNRSALAAALSEAEAARLDARQAEITLSTAIARAYADLVQLHAGLDAAENALQVRRQTARLFGERLENGLENAGSFAQQSAAEASAEADIEALQESIGLARNRLAALTGTGPDMALGIARPGRKFFRTQGLPANIPAELIGRRPDVLAARYRVTAAAKRVRVAQTAFYPNINLAAYIGRQSLGLDLFFERGSTIGAYGPAISLPIFEGGRLSGGYTQVAAEYDIAVAQYNGAVTRALNEIADAATSRKALDARTARIRKAVAASERAHKVALDRYKGGLSTYLDVLRAEDGLIVNRRALAEIETRAFVLDVDLVRALGGGFAGQPTGTEEKNGR
jgi:NodT family efflux transporter outer membrane factor (OMF) lipoprotein